MAQAEPIVRIENLGTNFAGRWIHRHLDLAIEPNRIVSLIGASGCGKTTLLREILLLQPISEGKIYLMGDCISGVNISENQRRQFACHMGMMFQQGALFSAMTVLENVMFPLMEYTDFDRATIREIARLKIAMTGLVAGDVADLYPSALSGGMRKRVALARALALDPKILMLDEPSAGLDPKGAYELDVLIKTLQESLGLTVIMITHDLDTIWGIVDEVVYLDEKKVVLHASVNVAAKQKKIAGLASFFNSPRGRAASYYREILKQSEVGVVYASNRQ